MPILGRLLTYLFGGLWAGVVKLLGEKVAWNVGIYTAVVALMSAAWVGMSACLNSLRAMATPGGAGGGGGALWDWFMMGLGLFVPSNAAALIACYTGVLSACFLFRLKMLGVLALK